MADAEANFQHAIDRDPEYGPAYVSLAAAKYNQSIARGSSYQTDAELTSVRDLAIKAVQLDPDSPSGHALLGHLAMQYDRDWARAERELRSGIAGSPNSGAESQYAFFLLFRGRFSEADSHLARMADLDPFSQLTQLSLVLIRYMEGRFWESRELAQKAGAEHPKVLWPQQMAGLNYVEEGHPELALPIFQAIEPHFPGAAVFEAMALAKAGKREEAKQLIRPFELNYSHPDISLEWLAIVYSFMRDAPNTVKWLRRSSDLHEFQSLSVAVDPAFAWVRNSPEFRALEKHVGL